MPAPATVLALMERVADWQLAHEDSLDHMPAARPSARNPRDWQQATFWLALTELADRDPRYTAPVLALGRREGWQLGANPFHADDQLIAQVWEWASRHGAGAAALDPAKAYFDNVFAHRPRGDLAFVPRQPGSGDSACTARWCWCDALFMAPPTLLHLGRSLRDPRYAAFVHEEFRATADYLYDPGERLFFRDSRFFDRRDAHGRKLFWSRGNGWVMAGLARIIGVLPADDPQRQRLSRALDRADATLVDARERVQDLRRHQQPAPLGGSTAVGIPSMCSAHPVVLAATLRECAAQLTGGCFADPGVKDGSVLYELHQLSLNSGAFTVRLDFSDANATFFTPASPSPSLPPPGQRLTAAVR